MDNAQRILEYFGAPPPTTPMTERLRRRMAFRNERTLFHRKCDLTGEPIVSVHSSDSPYKVFSAKAWWSDGWTLPEADFDFSRPFFEQFRELQLKAPRIELLSKNNENARYANHSSDNKNGYLLFSAMHTEDCMYCTMTFRSKDLVDCFYMYDNSELCYESFFCSRLYRSAYCVQCQNSRDLYFCFDCLGCNDCFLSSNLRHKQYVFMNQELSREEYEEKVARFKRLSHSDRLWAIQRFGEMLSTEAIHEASYMRMCENCRGDHLLRCKNCDNCYYVENAEDCVDLFQCPEIKTSFSTNNAGLETEMLLECMGIVRGSFLAYCHYTYDVANLMYCDHVFNSTDCFGCVGLKNGKYRIFNKQYSPEKYENLKAQIIEHMKKTGEWGRFFPPQLSPFPYNHTIGHQMFPLSKEEALAQGYRWEDEKPTKIVGGAIPASQLPGTIDEVDGSIIEQTIVCEESGKPFRVLKAEFEFYKKMGLPLPRKHPDVRHLELLRFRQLPEQFSRACGKCGSEILSNFAANRPEKVYCEQCYLAEVY